jgi:hypothetical protein
MSSQAAVGRAVIHVANGVTSTSTLLNDSLLVNVGSDQERISRPEP